MSADEIRVERVTHKQKRDDLIRVWHDGPEGPKLIAATCRVDGVLHPAEELVSRQKSPGGRALQCRTCCREESTAYRASPEGREKGRESARRWREANPEKVRENNRRCVAEGRKAESARRSIQRNAARTPNEVLAKRAELRPDGLKKCRGCRHLLPLGAFFADVTRADGLNDKCRVCSGAYYVAWKYGTYLDSWEDRDLWRDAYTGEDYAEIEHTIPKTAFEPGDADPDDPRNLSPASVWTNRGAGGKHTKDPLDFVEELYPGLLDKLAHWPAVEVTLRPRAAA